MAKIGRTAQNGGRIGQKVAEGAQNGERFADLVGDRRPVQAWNRLKVY